MCCGQHSNALARQEQRAGGAFWTGRAYSECSYKLAESELIMTGGGHCKHLALKQEQAVSTARDRLIGTHRY